MQVYLDSGNVSEAIRATFSEMLSSRDAVEEELCRQVRMLTYADVC